ncbi:hypothetical protein ACP4OV_001850 [Aristida adscensionis]
MPPPPPATPPASAAAAAAPQAAVLQSVQGLASYSDALADFLDQWNSVLLDVASIAATFAVLFPAAESDAKPASAADPGPNPAPEPEPEPEPPHPAPAPPPEPEEQEPERLPNPVPEPEEEQEPKPAASDPVQEPEAELSPNPAPNARREREDGDSSAEELGRMCEQMAAREVRRYVAARLRDREWLRAAGPGALRRAPDPATLVLRAVGRYYICAGSKDAEAACLLLLELYVRAGCPRRRDRGQREAELREEARETALTWRSRILHLKGRLGDASAREARGLALFMAAFGVPDELPAQELYELLEAGDGMACTKVFRFSKPFVRKMRDVVVEMINKDMYLQAIRLILAFEFQNAFPLGQILTHIMEKVEHGRKEESEELALIKRDKEELTLLRSITKCVEDHKLCPSEFSDLNITERIALLEERVGKQKQAFTGIKRKRTTDEDNVELNAL